MSVVLIAKGPDRHCVSPALSNLVKLWRAPDVDESLAHPTTSSTSLQSRSQRCFSQFDRKTDCFDGGVAIIVISNGSQMAMTGFESPQSAASGLGNGTERMTMTVFCTTFKAVCGTQTRMPRGFKSAARDDFDPIEQDLERPQAVGCPQTYLKRPSWFHGSWTNRLEEVRPLSK